MRLRLVWSVGCVLLLHSPNGDDLWIRTGAIGAIKPVGKYQDHLAKNTHSIIYDYGKPLGVRETTQTIIDMIKGCEAQ